MMTRSRKSSRPARSLALKLPATSANLGPAFDAAAVALKIHLRVNATRANEFSIAAEGRDAEICKRLDCNLIVDTYREILAAERKEIVPLGLRIRNEIPIGKGLGSSAAARLAGIALANYFEKLRWSDERIVDEASRREGHGDNAAACWLGGLAIVSRSAAPEGTAFSAFAPKLRANWPILVAVSAQPLSTEEARDALPEIYSRADAVANVQHAMLLAHAFVNGIPELLKAALVDRLHEPFRAPLCPLLEPLRALVGREGILGAVLSGAGPSGLVILDPRASAARAKRAVEAAIRAAKLEAEILLTEIEPRGARDSLR